MSTSSHLPLLREMFPGKIFLDVKDIARCYNVSSGHIYNLSSAKKLPFKIEKSKTVGVCVSILAMAKYLDTLLEGEGAPDHVQAEAIPKRRPGRPRKNGGLTLFSLQSALSFELLVRETTETMSEVVEMISPGNLFHKNASGAESVENALHILQVQVMALRSKMIAVSGSLRPQFVDDRCSHRDLD